MWVNKTNVRVDSLICPFLYLFKPLIGDHKQFNTRLPTQCKWSQSRRRWNDLGRWLLFHFDAFRFVIYFFCSRFRQYQKCKEGGEKTAYRMQRALLTFDARFDLKNATRHWFRSCFHYYLIFVYYSLNLFRTTVPPPATEFLEQICSPPRQYDDVLFFLSYFSMCYQFLANIKLFLLLFQTKVSVKSCFPRE